MTTEPRDFSGIAVAVPVSRDYSRTSRRTMHWFLGRTFSELLQRSGLSKHDVDGLIVSSYLLAPDNAASLTDHFDISPRFLTDIPYGGSCGVIAMRRAARAIQNGDAEVIACMSGDIAQYGFGFNAAFSHFQRDHVYPYGGGGQNAVFALMTDAYMNAHGAELEDFGRLCIAVRQNSLSHPLALYRKPLTLDDYIGSRVIADPLRLFDCVTRVCGTEGYLVMTEDRARHLKLPHVRIAGSVERHNGARHDPVMAHFGLAEEVPALYAQAGVGPDDIDFVEAYDDYPVIIMMQLEALGFCGRGEAPKLIRDKKLTIGSELPVNTNGGMLSIGQAGAGGGFQGVTEAIRQLTGQALGAPVEGAEHGLVSCFGTVNYERGICCTAAILTPGHA